jgi:hypothetical protein
MSTGLGRRFGRAPRHRAGLAWVLFGVCCSCVSGCRGEKDKDPCASLTGKERYVVPRCLGGTANDWQVGGVHRVDGKLYSVMWRDHGKTQESDWANWCPDDYWRRDAVVLEMVSDDPNETNHKDLVVFTVRLDCKFTRTWKGLVPPAGYCSDAGPEVRDEHVTGSPPLEDYPFDCSPWPDGFEAPKDEVSYGACYENQLCPLGTECFPAQVKSECPPAGAACVDPGAHESDEICQKKRPLDCPGCKKDSDCPEGSSCGSQGSCERTETVSIDWVADCDKSIVKATGLPAGTYRVTALKSGASAWDTSRWIYAIHCNLSAPNVSTAPGLRYPSADEAFAHVLSVSEDVNFEGGDLVCGYPDDNCGDNTGRIKFRVDLVCPSCGDGILSGDESDVDCGGAACEGCGVGEDCRTGTDCTTGVCEQDGLVCAKATCDDGVKNASETDVDCGGPSCESCDEGAACSKGRDCATGVCDEESWKCAAPACSDKVQNGVETDIDCGGPTCDPCEEEARCSADSDCVSGVCETASSSCAPPACDDGVRNGDETDVDCGGTRCSSCAPGLLCLEGSDCATGVCGSDSGLCMVAACDDGVKNGDEQDIDCGGATCVSCALECPGCKSSQDCPTGSVCGKAGLCAREDTVVIDWLEDCGAEGVSHVMASGLPAGTYRVMASPSAGSLWGDPEWIYRINCANLSVPNVATPDGVRYASSADAYAHLMAQTSVVNFMGGDLVCGITDHKCSDNSGSIGFRLSLVCPSCGDGIQSGDESDVDCGGSACDPCADGKECKGANDCGSGVCDATSGSCAAPTCGDGVQNGDETGVDCGGPSCPECP